MLGFDVAGLGGLLRGLLTGYSLLSKNFRKVYRVSEPGSVPKNTQV
jgi:hypothetical protein